MHSQSNEQGEQGEQSANPINRFYRCVSQKT